MDGEMKSFHSHGKLLLTGEYLVLEGALAFAIPTTKGQTLHVEKNNTSDQLHWKAINHDGSEWLSCTFDDQLNIISTNNREASERLRQLLLVAVDMKSQVIEMLLPCSITTQLEFPRDWGLGSSSTLIYNLSQWLEIDPYQLLKQTFGGSGYDIAVAQKSKSLYFQLKDGKPQIELVNFNPSFNSELFFVHLGKKQNSREEIKAYKKQIKEHPETAIIEISNFSRQLPACKTLNQFSDLMVQHEEIIAKTIGKETIKERLFPDYPGFVKSLGAWGGDFVLSAGDKSARDFFKNKGFETVVEYGEMALKQK